MKALKGVKEREATPGAALCRWPFLDVCVSEISFFFALSLVLIIFLNEAGYQSILLALASIF